MIGSIPARTFEDDPGRGIYFAQAILATFRATLQRFVVKRLMAVELYSTILTAIRINRHTSSLSERRMIIALFRLSDKTRPLAYMAFSKSRIYGGKQVKGAVKMTGEPSSALGGIIKTSLFDECESQIVDSSHYCAHVASCHAGCIFA